MDEPQAAPRWTGIPSIGLSFRLNEQWIELFCEIAATATLQAPPPFVLHNREFWCRLDTDARRRAAAFPFVIVDFNFKNADGWQRDREYPGNTHGLPPKLCEDLLYDTLLFAQQAAREDMNVAIVTFGLLPAVARQVASLTPPQLRGIANGNTGQLRVRWTAEFWREIPIAAQLADEAALKALRHQAKLLFCGEFTQPALHNPADPDAGAMHRRGG